MLGLLVKLFMNPSTSKICTRVVFMRGSIRGFKARRTFFGALTNSWRDAGRFSQKARFICAQRIFEVSDKFDEFMA